MGLFDVFRKRAEDKYADSLSQFSRTVTQDVALFLAKTGATSSPFLLSLNEDGGIFEGVSYGHINNPIFLNYKSSPDVYLFLLCAHAFGAGVYVAHCQNKYGKGANMFTEKEMYEIRDAFNSMDLYELGLNTLGIGADSRNKRATDSLIQVGIQSAKSNCSNLINKRDYLKEMMRVMYYSGVTIAAAFRLM